MIRSTVGTHRGTIFFLTLFVGYNKNGAQSSINYFKHNDQFEHITRGCMLFDSIQTLFNASSGVLSHERVRILDRSSAAASVATPRGVRDVF